MKILQINSVYIERSTGRTCYEVEKAVEAAGGQCVTAYGFGPRRNTPNAYKIGTKAEYYFHNIMGRITGLCGYFSVFATMRLIRFIRKYDPDVIHLRNLHAFYVNLPILFRYLKKAKKPVILNVHDCWIFTGKCPHYTVNGCDGWLKECGKCPNHVVKQYPQSLFFDFSKKMFRDKKKWLCDLDKLTVVGVSDWTAEQAKRSFLGNRQVKRIYNWINMDVFKPYPDNIFPQLNIPADKFTVVCAAVAWGESSQKYQELKHIIENVDADVQFVIVGNVDTPFPGENVHHICYVSDTAKLAQIYSASDVYVHFSLEDTFGKVIAEALSCGIPTIVYDSTSCKEIADETCGITVAPHDTKAIVKAISQIKADPRRYSLENCRKRVEENFDYEKNTTDLIQLYQQLMEN